MRIFFFILALFYASPVFSQAIYRGAVNSEPAYYNNVPARQYNEPTESSRFKDSDEAIALQENLQDMHGRIGSTSNEIKARNLLMLKKVLDFKIQDATLAPDIAKMQNNREFNSKLLKALNKLDNKKNRSTRDQEVINILNDAGNRIYNYLAN